MHLSGDTMRPIAPRLVHTLTLAAAALSAACAPDAVSAPTADAAPAPAAAASFALHLTTPNADDAGLLVALDGAQVDSVTTNAGTAVLLAGAEGGAQLVLSARDDNRLRGVVATVWTRDGVAPRAELREAAARGTHAQRPLAGYSLRVSPADAAR
jgi:hypothetical protein